MWKLRSATVAFVAGAAIISASAAASAKGDTARYSKAPVYVGTSASRLTVALAEAGGGAAQFDSARLLRALAGAKTLPEVASLQQKFGAANVRSFLDVFNFVVPDALGKVTAARIGLAGGVAPRLESGGRSLAAQLYALGVYDDKNNKRAKTFDAEYLLDHLVTHRVHLAVMDDIDAKFGQAADENYHAVLMQMMTDLKGIDSF